jgi:hypothetical protein
MEAKNQFDGEPDPEILKTGGPRPSFTELSTLSTWAPIDVKAKRQLYCLIFCMNLLDVVPPSKRDREANGSG